jgi:A/G-specific adenine glycosylase
LTRLLDFRHSIDSGAAREELWRKAAMLVPKHNARIYNSALTDLGALVCIPREPKCGVCPVKIFCGAKDPENLPVRRSPPQMKRLTEPHAFVRRAGKILLEQSSDRWRGMWILPPLKLDCLKHFSFSRRPIHTAVFPFTHHRVYLRVFRHQWRKVHNERQRWFAIGSLGSIPIPSPHRRAIRTLLKS